MIYVILGMHKSGTTLLAQMLHHSGINMGEHDTNVSYDLGNKYERESSLKLNMDILGHSSDRFIDQPAPKQLVLSQAHRQQMRDIIQQCNADYPNWGFKDPRSTLLYPLWADELPPHKIIAIYRTPSEMWPRFRYDGWRYAYTNPQNAWNCVNRWSEHNLRLVQDLQQSHMPFIMLNYRDLMSTPAEFDRLQNFVGQPLNDQRHGELYRGQPKTYKLLETVAWFAAKTNGYHYQEIIDKLEALRTATAPSPQPSPKG